MKTRNNELLDVSKSKQTSNLITKETTMRLAHYTLLGIVLLGGLDVDRAEALTYVLTEQGRRNLEAEYRTLTAQRQQTQKDIRNLCTVLSSNRQMFVYSLYGTNRWEYFTTNQVAVRMRQLCGTDAAYRAYWNMLLKQHLAYGQYVRNQLLPQLQQRLGQIDQRLQYVTHVLANSTGGGNGGGLSNVSVKTSPVHIRLWDHGTQDGDIVQLFVNGTYYRQIQLAKGGTTVSLPLAYGQHRLEVLAMNEGSDGPNTASIAITGVVRGKPEQSWSLKTGQRAGMWINVGT